jgi:hypothetical protein
MAVLRRPLRARGEGDLADAKAMAGRAPVLQDPHLRRPELDHLAAGRRDY